MNNIKSFNIVKSPKASNKFNDIFNLLYPIDILNKLLSNIVDVKIEVSMSNFNNSDNFDKINNLKISDSIDREISNYVNDVVWYSQTLNEVIIANNEVICIKLIRLYFDSPDVKENIINDILLPMRLSS